jgi:hypothetical protein
MSVDGGVNVKASIKILARTDYNEKGIAVISNSPYSANSAGGNGDNRERPQNPGRQIIHRSGF